MVRRNDRGFVRNSYFFNARATTDLCPLSLHDALPIYSLICGGVGMALETPAVWCVSCASATILDRKSTRLNSQSPCYLVCRLQLGKYEEKTELQPACNLVCRLLLGKKK